MSIKGLSFTVLFFLNRENRKYVSGRALRQLCTCRRDAREDQPLQPEHNRWMEFASTAGSESQLLLSTGSEFEKG